MLSQAENKLLTRVGPGTAMGNLLRRFWQPFALTSELPEPDSDPIRVRLLGEDLVAFRDSNGEVGLLAANCPHRGASLFFGRNEEAGLRCVYHGWKFSRDGICRDMPNEPAESDFRSRVRAVSYPVEAHGDVLWAYLGPETAEERPNPPALEWTHVPASHRLVTKRIQVCNFLQNVEGEVDSSHVSFLHSKSPTAASAGVEDLRSTLPDYMARDKAPRFFVLPTEYGLAIGARRDAESDSYYWRITQFLMPSYTMIPVPVGFPVSFTGATPIDDEHMMGFTVTWHPDRPLTAGERAQIQAWTGVHTEVDPKTFRPLRNKDNEYLLDRELQRSGRSYTGIRGIREEDLAVQEGMGPIFDRTTEHLGTSDLAVIAMRRRLLEAVTALAEDGEVPYEARNADAYRVRSAALVLPRTVEWNEGAAEVLVARV
ncbi:MAG TPA: Rieske 2Fe-2S domain-containing protein [Chloroflexota bacterium]|nr:Rieske 2Fe-2S domain-containing protein [Chloroflexota bacterium]